MKPFFENPERIAALREAVLPWLGTPFMESCGGRARPGVCADCTWVAFPLQSLSAIGVVPWPRRYVSRGGGAAMLETLLSTLDATERLVRIWRKDSGQPPVPSQVGDVLVYSTGTRMHHLAVSIGDGTVVHSWNGSIQLTSAADQRDTLLYAIYRPMQ